MESSFTKGYDKTVAGDGTITLKFRTARFGGQAVLLAMVLTFAMVPASLFAASMLVTVLAKIIGFGTEAFMLVFVFALPIWMGSLFVMFRSSCTLYIKPLEGLIFSGKRLPFKDISHIGTSNIGNSAFVLANSHGKEIAIGKYVSIALAGAIAQEIRDASGMTWS